MCLLDNGHYHPTENVADKIPSLLLFSDKVALHVTRGVRWDSDHVAAYNDELKEIAAEIVKAGTDRVLIGMDYFDASINRVAAWVLGMRNMQKALLNAMLTPYSEMTECQNSGDFTSMLVLGEEAKTLPFNAVWDEFCRRAGVVSGARWLEEIKKYEADVLSLRK